MSNSGISEIKAKILRFPNNAKMTSFCFSHEMRGQGFKDYEFLYELQSLFKRFGKGDVDVVFDGLRVKLEGNSFHITKHRRNDE